MNGNESMGPPGHIHPSERAALDRMGDLEWVRSSRGRWFPIGVEAPHIRSHTIMALWRAGYVEKVPGSCYRVRKQAVPGLPAGVWRV